MLPDDTMTHLQRINQYLTMHPENAINIAFAAVAAVCIEPGSDRLEEGYEVGGADLIDRLWSSFADEGLAPLLERLRAEDPDEAAGHHLEFHVAAVIADGECLFMLTEVSKDTLESKLAAWCVGRWDSLGVKPGPVPLANRDAIETYFDDHPSEDLHRREATLPLPPAAAAP